MSLLRLTISNINVLLDGFVYYDKKTGQFSGRLEDRMLSKRLGSRFYRSVYGRKSIETNAMRCYICNDEMCMSGTAGFSANDITSSSGVNLITHPQGFGGREISKQKVKVTVSEVSEENTKKYEKKAEIPIRVFLERDEKKILEDYWPKGKYSLVSVAQKTDQKPEEQK